MLKNKENLVFEEVRATGFSCAQVGKIAESIAEHLKFDAGGNLVKLVKSLGGRVIYQDLNEWLNTEDGSVRVYGPGDFEIYLSNFTGPLRDRFTVAHELGHYFLHSNMGSKKIRAERHGTTLIEREANWFAAGFLMPERKFALEWEKTKSIQRLASVFMVSFKAAEVRVNSLGLQRKMPTKVKAIS